jgi:uncharacterized protein HemX
MLIGLILCAIGAFLVSFFVWGIACQSIDTQKEKDFLVILLFLICLLALGTGVFGNEYKHQQTATEAQKESEQNEKRLHERNQYLREQLELGFEQRENYKQILSDSLEILKMKNEIKTLNEGK